jgi:hypothetical protein
MGITIPFWILKGHAFKTYRLDEGKQLILVIDGLRNVTLGKVKYPRAAKLIKSGPLGQ